MVEPKSILTADDERVIVAEIAHRTLAQTAPDELPVFDDAAADYFRNPQQALAPNRRDESVGFGLELALLTPYVLAVATSAVHVLGAIVSGAVQEEGTPAARSLIRRLFRLPDHNATQPVPLSIDQARQVHGVAFARAQALGLSDAQAGLLADSITGGLVAAR